MRKIIAILLLISFVALPVSAAVFTHYTADPWRHIHILSGVIFLISGIFHISLNWKSLKRYLVDKK